MNLNKIVVIVDRIYCFVFITCDATICVDGGNSSPGF